MMTAMLQVFMEDYDYKGIKKSNGWFHMEVNFLIKKFCCSLMNMTASR